MRSGVEIESGLGGPVRSVPWLRAQDHRNVGRRGFRLQEPAELNPRDAGHPQIADDSRRRRGERYFCAGHTIGRLVHGETLGPQTGRVHLPRLGDGIDEDDPHLRPT